MEMPDGFRYADVFRRGRPVHEKFDRFSVKHPRMDAGRRAKIFAPFDALKGFGDAVASKDILYTDRVMPEGEEAAEISRRLSVLGELAADSRKARMNRVRVKVRYFALCSDENDFSYGIRGRYETAEGICLGVDSTVDRCILVGDSRIPLDDIVGIEDTDGVFYKYRDYCDQ